MKLSTNANVRVHIGQSGGIEALIAAAKYGSVGKEHAAGALWRLAFYSQNQVC